MKHILLRNIDPDLGRSIKIRAAEERVTIPTWILSVVAAALDHAPRQTVPKPKAKPEAVSGPVPEWEPAPPPEESGW